MDTKRKGNIIDFSGNYAVRALKIIVRMKLYSVNTGYFKLDGGAMFGAVPKPSGTNPNPADGNNLCSILHYVVCTD